MSGAAVVEPSLRQQFAAVSPPKTLADDVKQLKRAMKAAEFDAAERIAVRILNYAPKCGPARIVRGVMAWRRGEPEVALNQLRRASRDDPAEVEGYRMLGRVALEAGPAYFAEGLDAYRSAAALKIGKPEETSEAFGVAMAELFTGDWVAGWASHEVRVPEELRRNKVLLEELQRRPRPHWNGLALDGTLLVHMEQGYGDALLFARYLACVKAKRIVLKVPPALGRLMRTLPDMLSMRCDAFEVDDGPRVAWPAFDAWCLVGSLPHLLKLPTKLGGLCPYFDAPPSPALAGESAHVGLVWGGNPAQPRDAQRSMPVEHVAELLAEKSVTWHVLQRGPHLAELPRICALVRERGGEEPRVHFEDRDPDFYDTARLVKTLDATVTVCTSVAHLVGSLGARGFVLLSTTPDWRWGHGAVEGDAFYPSLTTIRQPFPGRWDRVVERTIAAVRGLNDV